MPRGVLMEHQLWATGLFAVPRVEEGVLTSTTDIQRQIGAWSVVSYVMP